MAEVTSVMIKELRDKTQAGMMDCKKALTETSGDMDKAVEFLRKKGLASADKQMGKEATEGIVTSYIHSNGKLGVLLELKCVTDFVARNEKFKELGHEIAMHIAATAPTYAEIEEVPSDIVDKEKEIYREQMLNSGKPENVIEKIVEGKLGKFYSEICLVEQEFIKDNTVKIKDLIKENISTFGENIQVGKFSRFQIG